MAIDDASANREASRLNESLKNGNAAELHENLLSAAGNYDKDSFNKVVSSLNEMNKKDRDAAAETGRKLPSLEIHNDFFGMGKTDQIVMKDENGKKTEIYESREHRQKELEDANKQGQGGLNLDLGRLYASVFQASDWQGNRTDFHTDSSVSWKDQSKLQNTNQAPVIRDYSNNGNRIGSYDYGPDARRINSDEDLQEILNNPPQGYNSGSRKGF